MHFLVDSLSDIFSLGVIVYEMAAGNRPFLGESLATISNRILSQMPIPASDLNPQMSPATMFRLTLKNFSLLRWFDDGILALQSCYSRNFLMGKGFRNEISS